MEYHSYNKTQYGVRWELIFYQNNNSLFTKEDVLFHNSTHRFSILNTLSDRSKINGYFTFHLEYPQDLIIQWKQTVNPIYTYPGQTDVGYKPINIPSNCRRFSGLAQSTDSSLTFLDGVLGDTTIQWWYAIGTFQYFSFYSIPGIPNCSAERCYGVEWVKLWLFVGFQMPFTKNYTFNKILNILIISLISVLV